jgi:hypothetical protein
VGKQLFDSPPYFRLYPTCLRLKWQIRIYFSQNIKCKSFRLALNAEFATDVSKSTKTGKHYTQNLTFEFIEGKGIQINYFIKHETKELYVVDN